MRDLQKEIFLLEHGFYDEEVRDFVNKNLELFFSKETIEAHWENPEDKKTVHPRYLSGVKLEYKHGVYLVPDFNENYERDDRHLRLSAPLDVKTYIFDEWGRFGNFLLHARREYFKKIYGIKVKT